MVFESKRIYIGILSLISIMILTSCLNTNNDDLTSNSETLLEANMDNETEINTTIRISTSDNNETSIIERKDDETKVNEDIDYISTIRNVDTVYSLQTNADLDINEVADKLLSEMLTDLKKEDCNRSFIIIDYKDICYTLFDKNSKDEYVTWRNLNDNTWFIVGSVWIKYKGIFSPIGSDDIVPEDEYVVVDLGERYIIKNNDIYSMESIIQ